MVESFAEKLQRRRASHALRRQPRPEPPPRESDEEFRARVMRESQGRHVYAPPATDRNARVNDRSFVSPVIASVPMQAAVAYGQRPIAFGAPASAPAPAPASPERDEDAPPPTVAEMQKQLSDLVRSSRTARRPRGDVDFSAEPRRGGGSPRLRRG